MCSEYLEIKLVHFVLRVFAAIAINRMQFLVILWLW